MHTPPARKIYFVVVSLFCCGVCFQPLVDSWGWFTSLKLFRITSLASGQSYGCPSITDVTLLDADNTELWLTVIKTHYNDVIMGALASQITSLTIVYSAVYSDVDHRKHQSSASLAFVRRIHRWPVNSPHKWPVTGKMIPFDDVIMNNARTVCSYLH